MLHYVEKPNSFVSTTINCGVYLFSLELLTFLSNIFKEKHEVPNDEFLLENDITKQHSDSISLEKDVFMSLVDSNRLFVFNQHDDFWWSPIKTPGSAIYANRNYLSVYRKSHPELLIQSTPNGQTVIGDVYIHPSASVDPTAIILT